MATISKNDILNIIKVDSMVNMVSKIKWDNNKLLHEYEVEMLDLLTVKSKEIVKNIIERLEHYSQQELFRDAAQHAVCVLPKNEAVEKLEKFKNWKNKVVIGTDVLNKLLEYAHYSKCRADECKVKNWKACQVRRMLLNANAPLFDENAQGCKYKMNLESEDK